MRVSSKERDVVYTKPVVALELLTESVKLFPELFDDATHFVEPSAGSGAFMDALQQTKKNQTVIGLDINPKRDDIEKMDFFNFELRDGMTQTKTVIVGNPPFSIVNSFLMKCAKLCSCIMMILPQKFSQNVPKTCLPDCWKVLYQKDLPDKIFEGKQNLNCVYLILQRIEGYIRPKKKKPNPDGFAILTFPVKRELIPDILFWQSGAKAGQQTTVQEIGNSKAYGCFFDENKKSKKQKLIDQNVSIPPLKGTNNRLYITSQIICDTLNNLDFE